MPIEIVPCTSIRCDGCGCGYDEVYVLPKDEVKHLKRAGWTGTYKKCFCPTCSRDKRRLTVNIRQIEANALHAEISKWPESVMYKDWVQSAIANAPTITQPEVDLLLKL